MSRLYTSSAPDGWVMPRQTRGQRTHDHGPVTPIEQDEGLRGTLYYAGLGVMLGACVLAGVMLS